MDKASLEEFLSRGLSLEAIGRRVGDTKRRLPTGLRGTGFKRPIGIVIYRVADCGKTCWMSWCDQVRRSPRSGRRSNERSKGTVRHWLARFGLETRNGRGRRPSREARAAREAGLTAQDMSCPRHGETEFSLDGRGCYRCKRCRSAAVTRRRRKVKAILVDEAGGACCICGYASNMRALHFHHVEPADKRLEINAKGVALSLETLRAEAQKCVLLCSNCHAEVEDGTASISAVAGWRASRSSP